MAQTAGKEAGAESGNRDGLGSRTCLIPSPMAARTMPPESWSWSTLSLWRVCRGEAGFPQYVSACLLGNTVAPP